MDNVCSGRPVVVNGLYRGTIAYDDGPLRPLRRDASKVRVGKSARNFAYREKNRENTREYMREYMRNWREKNRENTREYMREYMKERRRGCTMDTGI